MAYNFQFAKLFFFIFAFFNAYSINCSVDLKKVEASMLRLDYFRFKSELEKIKKNISKEELKKLKILASKIFDDTRKITKRSWLDLFDLMNSYFMTIGTGLGGILLTLVFTIEEPKLISLGLAGAILGLIVANQESKIFNKNLACPDHMINKDKALAIKVLLEKINGELQ